MIFSRRLILTRDRAARVRAGHCPCLSWYQPRGDQIHIFSAACGLDPVEAVDTPREAHTSRNIATVRSMAPCMDFDVLVETAQSSRDFLRVVHAFQGAETRNYPEADVRVSRSSQQNEHVGRAEDKAIMVRTRHEQDGGGLRTMFHLDLEFAREG
ncbi:hypothetical protein VTO73DRAFT_8367 [Trametes versicolor]